MILPEATSDTLTLTAAATAAEVRRLWRAGYRDSKARVGTVDLVRLAASQRAMPQAGREKAAALVTALDSGSRRSGCGAVVAAAGQPASRGGWSTKFEMRSPHYTMRLDGLPVIAA